VTRSIKEDRILVDVQAVKTVFGIIRLNIEGNSMDPGERM
jgi:hypothetical protein